MTKRSFQPARVGDFYIDCDICGMPCWYSESVVLSVYTGKGGLRVCPEDADAIDYGLVPYKLPAEQSIPDSRDTLQDADPDNIVNEAPPFNTGTQDPMSPPVTAALMWQQQSLSTWENWFIATWQNLKN